MTMVNNAIYSKVIAEYYDFVFQNLFDDKGFYLEEAQKTGSPVLEIGCGTGRILLSIASAGISITGLDNSDAMLSVAKRKLGVLDKVTQSNATLIMGDMRTFSFEDKFKLILIPFRAFLHLLTIDEQRQTLARVHQQLADNGRLILNFFDPDSEIISAFAKSGGVTRKLDEFIYPQSGNRVLVWGNRDYDLDRQILNEDWIFEEIDNDGVTIRRCVETFALRMIYRYEMQHLLELMGFQVHALYGDFDRSSFKAGMEQIWVAQKA